jgi:uncharacterized protein
LDRNFTSFLKALRGADVRVSVAETLDAMAVADLVGWQDRAVLKDALGLALAKTPEEKASFADCFDAFFAFDAFREGADDERPSHDADGERLSELSQRLLADDRTELAVAMQEAAAVVGVESIRFFTQRGLYVQRILNEMGVQAVDADIAALAGAGDGSGGAGTGAGQALKEARAHLFEEVRDFVEQQLSLQGAATSKELREDRLRRSRLGNLDRRDQEEMKKLVARIAKRLAAMHSRKRKLKNRGVLDVRRTMRRNYANDGILFELSWKRRKLDRPKVMAICDVSGSVAAVARFLLQFLYELHDLLNEVRSFAFSGRLIETSQLFEHKPVDDAVDAVMKEVGYMSTDYGESLANFKDGWLGMVDKRTTVIVLGDARSNFTDPRADILKEIHERAKRVLWLNPEPPPLWNTGDSEMRRYRPYCDLVRQCSTLDHLERMVEDLLEIAHKIA